MPRKTTRKIKCDGCYAEITYKTDSSLPDEVLRILGENGWIIAETKSGECQLYFCNICKKTRYKSFWKDK